MSRCKHENAHQSTQLDEWLYCPDCQSHLRKREVEHTRFLVRH